MSIFVWQFDRENNTGQNFTETNLFSPITLDNSVSVSNVTNWDFESVQLPPFDANTKLKFKSIFDFVYGGVGLDNIELQTQQK